MRLRRRVIVGVCVGQGLPHNGMSTHEEVSQLSLLLLQPSRRIHVGGFTGGSMLRMLTLQVNGRGIDQACMIRAGRKQPTPVPTDARKPLPPPMPPPKRFFHEVPSVGVRLVS